MNTLVYQCSGFKRLSYCSNIAISCCPGLLVGREKVSWDPIFFKMPVLFARLETHAVVHRQFYWIPSCYGELSSFFPLLFGYYSTFNSLLVLQAMPPEALGLFKVSGLPLKGYNTLKFFMDRSNSLSRFSMAPSLEKL